MDFALGYLDAPFKALTGYAASLADGDSMAILLTLIFAAVALAALSLPGLLRGGDPMKKRLRQAGDANEPSYRAMRAQKTASKLAKLAPLDEQTTSTLRRRLARAGYDGPGAPTTYMLIRAGLAIGLPALLVLALPFLTRSVELHQIMVLGAVFMGIGFFFPAMAVSAKLDERELAVREGFPDSLDLMLVCVEAGLGLDAAINRVGDEMQDTHPVLAEHYQLMALELRAGRSRDDALRNFGERAGIDEIRAFANLLVQTDKLGTSMGDALRVYAEDMRNARMMRAEEKAHKLPVKMAAPLVLFMLPALMLIVMLPAIIQIVRVIMPIMMGTST